MGGGSLYGAKGSENFQKVQYGPLTIKHKRVSARNAVKEQNLPPVQSGA